MNSPSAEPPTWSGRPIPRLEDPAIVRGWGNYVADIASHNDQVLHARFVRSSVASGRIVSVAIPPDVTGFTAADLVEVEPIRAVLHRPDFVEVATPILAGDRVRFVGEPIAVVVAATEAEAEDAAERVAVEIEQLPAVLSASAALAYDAPIVHDDVPEDHPNAPNVVVDGRITTPNADAAFAAAHRTVSVRVSSGRQSAMPLEARAAHAAYGGLRAGGQHHRVGRRVRRRHVLDVPADDVAVERLALGGVGGEEIVPAESTEDGHGSSSLCVCSRRAGAGPAARGTLHV